MSQEASPYASAMAHPAQALVASVLPLEGPRAKGLMAVLGTWDHKIGCYSVDWGGTLDLESRRPRFMLCAIRQGPRAPHRHVQDGIGVL